MFLTGTDEHGQKIEDKAREAGTTPKEFVDRIVEGPRGVLDLWKLMNVSNDRFLRTTDGYHVESVQKIFKQMHENGDIYIGLTNYTTSNGSFFRFKKDGSMLYDFANCGGQNPSKFVFIDAD